MTIRFAGTPEILFHLGKALNKAQHAQLAVEQPTKARHLAEMDENLTAALEDDEFRPFINNYWKFLSEPTNSNPGGKQGSTTLPEVSNVSNYFGKLHLLIRAKGYEHFREDFLKMAASKWLINARNRPLFIQFLDALKPHITLADLKPNPYNKNQPASPSDIDQFTRHLAIIDNMNGQTRPIHYLSWGNWSPTWNKMWIRSPDLDHRSGPFQNKANCTRRL